MSADTGKYDLVRRLAAGGMAEVYHAKMRGPGGFEKDVCLKRILPQLAQDTEFVEMFKEEARLAAKLQHANIVQIFDFGADDTSYFIAMEFVDGRDLRDLLDAASRAALRLPPGLVAFIIQEAAKGLAHAHRFAEGGRPLYIVHRDVSPHNILVSRTGEVKVADFGIAKVASRATRTRTGVLKGKLAYMSPEQARGERLDGRSDVFALGLVLYELLTGKRPFLADTEPETLARVLTSTITPPAEIEASVPHTLSEVTMRALARDREQRYQRADDLAHDLARYLFTFPPEQVGASALGAFLAQVDGGLDGALERGRTKVASASAYEATASAAHLSSYPVAEPDDPTRLKDDTMARAATSITRSEIGAPPRRPRASRTLASVTAFALVAGAIVATWWFSRGPDSKGPPRNRIAGELVPGPPASAAHGPRTLGTPTGESSAREPDSGTTAKRPPTPVAKTVNEPSRAHKVAQPVPARRTAARRSRRSRRRRAPRSTRLVVKTVPPDARVSVDGARARRGPLRLKGLMPGRVLRLRAEASKHRPLSREHRVDKQNATITLELKPLPGRLHITAIPWAEYYIDEKRVREMPRAGVEVPAGTRQVRLVNTARRYNRTFSVKIPPAGTVRLVREVPLP